MDPEASIGTTDSEDVDLYLPQKDLEGKVPSAPPMPLGTAVLFARVKWPVGHVPRKDFALRKALQSWLRKDLGSAAEIEGLQYEDTTNWAKVTICPSTALENVLNQQFAQLKLKDSRIATVEFHRNILESAASVKDTEPTAAEIVLPVTLTMAVDVQKLTSDIQNRTLKKFNKFCPGDNTFSVTGSFTDVDKFYKEFCNTINPAPNGRDSESQTEPSKTSRDLTVPLVQYWYLNQLYREDMERIEGKYGVRIHSDISVSVQAEEKTSSESLRDASQELANLFQKTSLNVNLKTMSLPGVHQESAVVIDLMKDILKMEEKVVLSMSAQKWRLLGPEDSIATAQRMLDLNAVLDDPQSKGKGGNSRSTASKVLHGESECNKHRGIQTHNAPVQNLKGHVEASIGYAATEKPCGDKPTDKKVPKNFNLIALGTSHLTDGILMSGIHWKIMKNTFKRQIENIKTKFGVDFQEDQLKDGVNIRAVGNCAGFSLEVNAHNALLSLYQKVFRTTITCPLQNIFHTKKEIVKNHLNVIREHNPSLVVGEVSTTSGTWEMFGLPDHLRFAINEIEKRLGQPIFDKRYMDIIECEQNPEVLRSFADRSVWKEAKGNEAMEKKEAACGGAIYEALEEPEGVQRRVERFEEGAGRERAQEPGSGLLWDPFLKREALKGAMKLKLDKGDGTSRLQGQQDPYGEDTGKLGKSRARDYRAYGSSVDAVASVGVYGEDRQKLGEAGRKEISEHGKHKQWEKGAGSTRGPHGRALPAGADGGGASEDDNRPICMDEFDNKEKLPCGHDFCKECLRRSVESLGATCPVCKKVFRKVEGDQPDGTMTHHIQKSTLPGFKRCDTIVIDYNIPSGIQSINHPNPGKRFKGAHLRAYLPATRDGREVLELLKRAFEQRLVFTVGTSQKGGDDFVIWNGIHHKTSTHGVPKSDGYPDHNYLQRVREELRVKGIE